MSKGQVISGEFGRILIRQKSDEEIELGELLVAESEDKKVLMQVYDLLYGSQISQQNLELVSGMNLEEGASLDFMDAQLRNYNLALLKNLITINKTHARISKTLPKFFSEVREVRKEDLSFITKPSNPLYLGKLRSGSKLLDVGIFLPGHDVFSHHILIASTTGKGKSNLATFMLWDCVGKNYCGILVLDPHDEYYGRNKLGLKDHPSREKIVYYTPKNPPAGCRTLKINIEVVKPEHFDGVASWSDPQQQALSAYYRKFGKRWVENILLEKKLENVEFYEGTLAVVKRRLMSILGLEIKDMQIFTKSVFELNAGQTTANDIADELEKSNIVVIDTSSFSGSVEILIGSIIATEILNRYRSCKRDGTLKDKPVVSIVLEEAPRVLGKEVLERGTNIFETIAREGRKFKVGLTAITQLPSLIPRQILANMNTKIILGIEMNAERQAIIDSASQDLSSDSRNIASLDKGEAIITSNFARFATPIRIPLFEEFVKEFLAKHKKEAAINSFDGVKTS